MDHQRGPFREPELLDTWLQDAPHGYRSNEFLVDQRGQGSAALSGSHQVTQPASY
jgi:hypothetical protein